MNLSWKILLTPMVDYTYYFSTSGIATVENLTNGQTGQCGQAAQLYFCAAEWIVEDFEKMARGFYVLSRTWVEVTARSDLPAYKRIDNARNFLKRCQRPCDTLIK
jgi:hypothetical protein